MRLYIASTSEDLAAHRAAAREVAAELGFEVVTAAPARGAGRDAVARCARRIAGVEGVLAIVGWRRGEVPGPELGGDGRRSWTEWASVAENCSCIMADSGSRALCASWPTWPTRGRKGAPQRGPRREVAAAAGLYSNVTRKT